MDEQSHGKRRVRILASYRVGEVGVVREAAVQGSTLKEHFVGSTVFAPVVEAAAPNMAITF